MHIYKITNPSAKKGKESTKWTTKDTMGWKLIDGVRVWYNKEASV